jgi:polysaccharide biosynthesis transport protein
MDTTKNFTTQGSSESKLHFLDYWRIIRIRKTVILAVFLLVVLTTTAVTFVLKETYMSTVRISVDKDTSDIPGFFGLPQQNSFDLYFIQTEFEKIQSQMILDEVINDLKLHEAWAKRFNMDSALTIPQARSILKRQIDVRQSRNTSLIEIRVYSEDREEAAKIANRIAEVYRLNRLARKTEMSTKGIEKLNEQLTLQEDKVKALQEKVDFLRNKYRIADIETGFGPTGSTLEPETVRFLEKERVTAEQMFVQYQTLYKELNKKTRPELRKALPTSVQDEHLNRHLAELATTEQKYVVATKDLGQQHPEVERTASLINKLNEQIEARIDGIMAGLEAKVAQSEASVKDLAAKVEEAKKKDAQAMEQNREYFQARRDLETQQKIRDNIIFRIIQETVEKELPKTSIVQITDIAEPGLKPVRPNVALNITLGVVVGLIMGVGLAFFIEYLDTSVKTIDDVERSLQAPVVGVIPQNVGSLLDEGPDSPHAEAYRVLRTNILFSRKNPNANTLTVVSGGAGEGKSTTIFNLATVFAQSGQRVLVVDSDLRRPSLHKFLNVSNSIGLTNYLLRQNSLEEVIQTTPLPTLNFLPSGKLPSSSMGVLNSAQMKEFIRQAKERYDFVFFDSPPIMGVSDASILASEVDMALLVVQYRKYPQVMTIRAKQMVEKVGGTLLGVVLNNINISQDSYYYYYSGYYYDYYSKHEEEPSTKNGEPKNGEPKPAEGGRVGIDLKKKY